MEVLSQSTVVVVRRSVMLVRAPRISASSRADQAIESLVHRETSRLRVSGRQLAYGHLVIAVLFFAWFYPLWTGLPMSDHALLNGFPSGKAWFPTWV